MENFTLSSIPIEVSDFTNHKEATFLISVLDEYNLNDVMIEKENAEKYHKTIIGYPIVAYLKYDKNGKPDDFGGHELRAKYNSDTDEIEYYFATYPIGSVIDSWIEEREVSGYDGTKNVILIKTKLWKSRLPQYFKVFDKLWDTGKINSSWEISSSENEKTTKGKKLKVFEFIGNCVLGKSVKGAVNGAGVLEVASNNDFNYELSDAFTQDIQILKGSQSQTNEISNIDDESINDINKIEGGKDYMSEKELNTEKASMTDNDLYTKVRRAINAADNNKWFYIARLYPYEFKAVAYEWDRESEDSHVSFSYTVNSDETISIVSQTEVEMVFIPKSTYETQLSEIQEKLSSTEKEFAEAGKVVAEITKEKEALDVQISTLTVYKEKVEEMEKAEEERELAEKKTQLESFALEDNLLESAELETNENIATIFSELTLENFESSQEKIEIIKGRKAIERFKAEKQNKKEEVETSTTNTTTKETETANVNLNNEDEQIDGTTIMSSWLKGK